MVVKNLFKRSGCNPAASTQQHAPSKTEQERRRTSTSSRSSRRSSTGDDPVELNKSRSSTILGKILKAATDQPKLEHLVTERRWVELARILKTERGRDEVHAHALSASSTLLHRACRTGAPPEVVRALCTISPSLASSVDSRGRTALHEACVASACSVTSVETDVLSCLLEFDKSSASVADEQGRLPLHLASGAVRDCPFDDPDYPDARSFLGDERSGSGGKAGLQPLESKVVGLVLRAYPDAVNAEDEYDVTPIEYSILAGADRKTVRGLRKSSEVLRKRDDAERKAAKAEACFAERRRSMTSLSSSSRKVKRGAMAA